jgi:tRNA nucleotidyltransferase (CCA-adding enzyme)
MLSRAADTTDAEQSLLMLERTDALRKPQRFSQLLDTAALLVPVDKDRWQRALDAAKSIDAGAIAALHAQQPAQIKEAVRAARLQALS